MSQSEPFFFLTLDRIRTAILLAYMVMILTYLQWAVIQWSSCLPVLEIQVDQSHNIQQVCSSILYWSASLYEKLGDHHSKITKEKKINTFK